MKTMQISTTMQRPPESIKDCYSSESSLANHPPSHLFPYIRVFFPGISSFCKGYSALCILLLLQHMISGVGAGAGVVREVKLPDPAVVGESATLECVREDPEGDEFYSVRWYLNDEQFYSYILGNHPEKVNHEMEGVHVSVSQSDDQFVTLSKVTLDSEGVYRCEVMSEAPFFQTSVSEAHLKVVVLPETPEIRGLREMYHAGEMLNITCTARNSRPSARIVFELNGMKITPESGRVTEYPIKRGSHLGLFTSISQLLVPIKDHKSSLLEVKCIASVGGRSVDKSHEVTVEPAPSRMLFFNAGGPSASPLSVNLLAAMAIFFLLRIATTFI